MTNSEVLRYLTASGDVVRVGWNDGTADGNHGQSEPMAAAAATGLVQVLEASGLSVSIFRVDA